MAKERSGVVVDVFGSAGNDIPVSARGAIGEY